MFQCKTCWLHINTLNGKTSLHVWLCCFTSFSLSNSSSFLLDSFIPKPLHMYTQLRMCHVYICAPTAFQTSTELQWAATPVLKARNLSPLHEYFVRYLYVFTLYVFLCIGWSYLTLAYAIHYIVSSYREKEKVEYGGTDVQSRVTFFSCDSLELQCLH